MITVLETINLSTDYLNKKGIQSPRINSELLLAYVLNCKRLQLYLSFDRPLTQSELDSYRDLIKRRSRFEPLQYIIGIVEFYKLEFKVSPAVLIPRPETEILVETIIKNCSDKNKMSILDIGCGSGILGISLAVNLNNVSVYCSDISNSAINISKENARKHNVYSKIKFVNHDILSEEINFVSEIDIIVSNPPYISKNDFNSLQNEIKYFEPRYALTDESDGYSFFKKISSNGKEKLKTGGKLFFEIGEGQCSIVKNILLQNSFSEIKIVKDYQNIDRVIYGVKK
jgi:release factor glutamine methyltransferase